MTPGSTAIPSIEAGRDDPLRPVLEIALDAVVVMRADGRIADWNSRSEEIFGWSHREAVGQDMAELIIPEHYRQAHRCGLHLYLTTGKFELLNRRLEITALRKSGEEFPVELSIAPIQLADEILFVGYVRDISERQRTERLLARRAREAELLYRMTALAAETGSFEDALRASLAAVCELTGWPVGHACVPTDSDPLELVPSNIWHSDDNTGFYAALRDVTSRTRFPPGIGLPGRILETAEPLWIPDVEVSPIFVRARAPGGVGIRSAFGFPIKAQGRIIAVLEFFGNAPAEPDPELLLIMRSIGEQVGRVFERRQAQDRLKEETRALETINQINLSLAGELNLERLVQAVIDAAVRVTGAAFGAFFHNVVNEAGEAYMLYTLSGAPRDAFARFPMPRNTALFAPTFAGEGIVRIEDVTNDPRYGRSPPNHGMPPGHLPVRSYLAVPVVSRSGEVLGGLFFGHPEPGRFTKWHENILSAVAVQSAIGMDNARLYRRAEDEIAERRRIEQQQELLLAELNHRVKNTIAVVIGMARQTARGSASVPDFVRGFIERLTSLARAHRLLSTVSWDATQLRALVQEILGPYVPPEPERVQISGPNISIKPKEALALSMILHELVTNAAKYGALAVVEGALKIEWKLGTVGDRQLVCLRWRETGLTGVREPDNTGFGTKLIEASTRHDLGGKAKIYFREDGVECEIFFPEQS